MVPSAKSRPTFVVDKPIYRIDVQRASVGRNAKVKRAACVKAIPQRSLWRRALQLFRGLGAVSFRVCYFLSRLGF